MLARGSSRLRVTSRRRDLSYIPGAGLVLDTGGQTPASNNVDPKGLVDPQQVPMRGGGSSASSATSGPSTATSQSSATNTDSFTAQSTASSQTQVASTQSTTSVASSTSQAPVTTTSQTPSSITSASSTLTPSSSSTIPTTSTQSTSSVSTSPLTSSIVSSIASSSTFTTSASSSPTFQSALGSSASSATPTMTPAAATHHSKQFYFGISFLAIVVAATALAIVMWCIRTRSRRSIFCCGGDDDDDLEDQALAAPAPDYGAFFSGTLHDSPSTHIKKSDSVLGGAFKEKAEDNAPNAPSAAHMQHHGRLTPDELSFTVSRYPRLRPQPTHAITTQSVAQMPYSSSKLTVANMVAGDVSSADESSHPNLGVERPPTAHQSGALTDLRHDEFGTPREDTFNATPRFMRLAGQGLDVPWARRPSQPPVSSLMQSVQPLQNDWQNLPPLPAPVLTTPRHATDSGTGWSATLRQSFLSAITAVKSGLATQGGATEDTLTPLPARKKIAASRQSSKSFVPSLTDDIEDSADTYFGLPRRAGLGITTPDEKGSTPPLSIRKKNSRSSLSKVTVSADMLLPASLSLSRASSVYSTEAKPHASQETLDVRPVFLKRVSSSARSGVSASSSDISQGEEELLAKHARSLRERRKRSVGVGRGKGRGSGIKKSVRLLGGLKRNGSAYKQI